MDLSDARQLVTNALLDMGVPLEQARELVMRHGYQTISVNEHGIPQYRLPNGGRAGAAEGARIMARMLKEHHLRYLVHGDPQDELREQLRARGYAAEEIDAALPPGRIVGREADGTLTGSAYGGQWRGEDALRLATKFVGEQIDAARQAPAIEAAAERMREEQSRRHSAQSLYGSI